MYDMVFIEQMCQWIKCKTTETYAFFKYKSYMVQNDGLIQNDDGNIVEFDMYATH